MMDESTGRPANGRHTHQMLTFVSAILLVLFACGLIASFSYELIVWELVCVVGLSICSILLGRFSKSSDKLRADQTNRMLSLAGNTLGFMRKGLDEYSATKACEALLPFTEAESAAIYDKSATLLGTCGCETLWDRYGDPVPTLAAQTRFEYGAKFVIGTDATVKGGLPTRLKGCIVVPLTVQDNLVGMLKLYYPSHSDIDETQQAMAMGFAILLSNQLALAELDAKTELATKMELRALQAQINPHFLFNTINTIASLIRTDPRQARVLLREFAVFYRRTLESSQDLITIELELTQTLRYLGFERARFGTERIRLSNYVEPGLDSLEVPAFIIQPIVENAVGHAMRPDGEVLHIKIEVKRQGDDVVISVADDGVGMESAKSATAVQKGNSPGAGIALKNVDDRLKSCFGSGSGIHIDSVLNEGTIVYLTLAGAALGLDEDLDEESEQVEVAEAKDAMLN